MADPPDRDTYARLINSVKNSVAPPSGWSALQLPANVSIDKATGFEAQAFVNDKTRQIVMAFNGPTSSPAGAIFGHGASTTDMLIARGKAPEGYDARVRRFVTEVKDLATANGYSTDSSNIFAIGSSLGGYGAQYASALSGNGFGGANFGGPGLYSIPEESRTTPVTPFVNYLQLGDPVANLGTDTGINFAGLPGIASHHGTVAPRFGNAADQKNLQAAIAILTSPGESHSVAWGALFGLTVKTHRFAAYIEGLGINLTPPPPPPAPLPPITIDEFFGASPYRLNWLLDKDDNGVRTLDGKPVFFAPSGKQTPQYGANGQPLGEPVQQAVAPNGAPPAQQPQLIAGQAIGSDLGSARAPESEQAADPGAAIPADNATAATAPATDDDGAAAPQADGVEPEQAGEEVRSRRLSRSQRQSRKIGFLTAEISELRRLLAEQGPRPGDDGPGAEPLQEFSPQPADFSGDTLADERASSARPIREPDAVQEDAESSRQEQATDRAAGYRQQAAAAHLARIDQAKQRIPDFDQVIRSGGQVPIAPGVADEILNSEKSALLQYHLAGNPAKLAELNGLSGLNLAREIGRLESRLHLPTARTVTAASPPLSDVRGFAAPVFDPHKTDDMDAFASWLREDQARRRRA